MAMPEGFGLSMGTERGDGALFREHEVRHLSGHLLGLLGNGFCLSPCCIPLSSCSTLLGLVEHFGVTHHWGDH